MAAPSHRNEDVETSLCCGSTAPEVIPKIFEEIDDYLPRWLCLQNIMEMRKEYRPVPLGLTAGPAIQLCLGVTVLLWTLLPCFTFLAYKTATCADGFAKYSWFAWFAFFPALFTCLYLEILTFRHIVIPKVQILGRFSVKGLPCNSFYFWFFCSALESAVSYTSFVSAGLFYGTLLSDCDRNSELDHVWQTLRMGPIQLLNLQTMGMVTFAAQYLRLFYVLLSALPLEDCSTIDYETGVLKSVEYKTQYRTALHWPPSLQNHGAALVMLSLVNGMQTIAHGDLRYADAKAQLSFNCVTRKESPEAHWKAWQATHDHVMSQLRKGVLLSFLRDTVASGTLLNLQVSIIAITSGIENTNPWNHKQALLAIALTILSSGTRIIDSFAIAGMTCRWRSKLLNDVEDGRRKAEAREASVLMPLSSSAEDKNFINPNEHPDILAKKLELNGWWLALIIALMLNTLVWGYASLKLVMAFKCEDALWTVGGCVAWDATVSLHS